MATNAENVRVGVSGGVYVAPLGTTLPNDAGDSLDGAFVELGYVAEGGVTEAQGTSKTNIKGWQNGDIVRKVQTEHDLTYQFGLIETNADVLEAFYGNYDAGTVEINGAQPVAHAWVIEVLDGDDHIRIVIPNGDISDRGNVVYANGEAVAYPATITAFPDPDYSGDLDAPAKAYKYHELTTGS